MTGIDPLRLLRADMDTWSDRAACADPDKAADWWFSFDGGQQQSALAVCEGCDVSVQCLTYALENGIGDGIWGGLTPDQRTRLVNRWRRRTRQATA